MAERLSVFSMVVGVALLLTGIGLVILAFAVFGRREDATQAAVSATTPVAAALIGVRMETAVNTILIATDGSRAAWNAVEFGVDLAARQGADAAIVHVVPALDLVATSVFGVPGSLPHQPTAADRAPLEDATTLAAKAGVTAHAMLLTGDPVDEIVTHADSIDANLIIVGSRGHGAVAGAFLGSVSQGVLHEARRPVLVYRNARDVREQAVVAG